MARCNCGAYIPYHQLYEHANIEPVSNAYELAEKYLELAYKQDDTSDVEQLLKLSSKYHSVFTSLLSDYIKSKPSLDI